MYSLVRAVSFSCLYFFDSVQGDDTDVEHGVVLPWSSPLGVHPAVLAVPTASVRPALAPSTAQRPPSMPWPTPSPTAARMFASATPAVASLTPSLNAHGSPISTATVAASTAPVVLPSANIGALSLRDKSRADHDDDDDVDALLGDVGSVGRPVPTATATTVGHLGSGGIVAIGLSRSSPLPPPAVIASGGAAVARVAAGGATQALPARPTADMDADLDALLDD